MSSLKVQNIISALLNRYPDFFIEDEDIKNFSDFLETHSNNYEIVWRSLSNNELEFIAEKGLCRPIVTRKTTTAAYTSKL